MSKFKDEWINDMTYSLSLSNPDIPKKVISEFVKKKYKERLNNKECTIHNNYINKSFNTNLIDFIDWVNDNKPICAGYGIMYMNQDKAMNPNADMLDGFLTDRKKIKNTLKVLPQGSYEYDEADRAQNGKKRNANSWYGVSLSEVSAFFNKYVGVSITATGQSLLSTSENVFEQFLGGAFRFYGSDNLMTYVKECCSKKLSSKYKFLRLPSDEEVFNWLAFRVNNRDAKSDFFIRNIISNLSNDDKKKLFYTNNLFKFIEHQPITSLLIDIFRDCDDYRDAGKVPEAIADNLNKLYNMIDDVVIYKGFLIDRIYRFKNEERQAVVLGDTDSCMATISDWVKYCRDNIYDRANKPHDDITDFIAVSVKAFLLTGVITTMLGLYCKKSNVLDEYSPRINMKNEFLFSRIAIASTKKRYVCEQKLREGREFNPPKFDAKGVDFLKSTTREATRKYFEKVCINDILRGDIDINVVRGRLKELSDMITESLKDGNKDFLTPASVKNQQAYAAPYRIQGFTAVTAWNVFYPDYPIILPDIVDVVKVRLNDKKMIERFSQEEPERYQVFKRFYIDQVISGLEGKFVSAIAIPSVEARIPEWIIPYIDYESIVADNLNRFKSVMESLNIVDIKMKGGRSRCTNILNI